MIDLSALGSIEDFNDPFSEPQKILVYGAPKSGKTRAVGEMALDEHFKSVLWVDIENGSTTLMQLDKEKRKKISLLKIRDASATPRATQAVMKLVGGEVAKVCLKHGEHECPECTLAAKKGDTTAKFVELCLKNESTDFLLVLDSLTQLSSSVMNYILNDEKIDLLEKKGGKGGVTMNHYGKQGIILERILSNIQDAPYHVAVISHEREQEQDDKKSKIGPVGGTTNFSRGVGKFFGHVVRLEILNGNHQGTASTTANAKVVAGSRTQAKIMQDGQIKLVNLFTAPSQEEEKADTTVSAKKTLGAASGKQALKLGSKK